MTKHPKVLRPIFIALLTMMLVGAPLLFSSPARAAVINAIDPDSITITNVYGSNDNQAYVWGAVKVSANWSVPDYSAHAGDTFSMTMPESLNMQVGDFELTAADGSSFGTCTYAPHTLTCTLNESVEQRRNVHGSFWLAGEFNQTIDTETVNFNVNGTVTAVDLPGTGGVIWGTTFPTEPVKDGWFSRDDNTLINWRVAIPGKSILNERELILRDTYRMNGINLDLSSNFYPRVYKLKNTLECWNQQHLPGCATLLYGDGYTDPSVRVTVDEANDVVTAVFNGPFSADEIYVMSLQIRTDRPVQIGSMYRNVADWNGNLIISDRHVTAQAGGDASGQAVGHLNLHKTVTGDTPEGTVFPVTYSYELDGQTKTGTLDLNPDGTVAGLTNIPNGTEVTLTENVPTVAGYDFGDPVFSGPGVVDGGPNSPSATVTITGLQTAEVTLNNTITKTPVQSDPPKDPSTPPKVNKPRQLPETGNDDFAAAGLVMVITGVAASSILAGRRG